MIRTKNTYTHSDLTWEMLVDGATIQPGQGSGNVVETIQGSTFSAETKYVSFAYGGEPLKPISYTRSYTLDFLDNFISYFADNDTANYSNVEILSVAYLFYSKASKPSGSINVKFTSGSVSSVPTGWAYITSKSYAAPGIRHASFSSTAPNVSASSSLHSGAGILGRCGLIVMYGRYYHSQNGWVSVCSAVPVITAQSDAVSVSVYATRSDTSTATSLYHLYRYQNPLENVYCTNNGTTGRRSLTAPDAIDYTFKFTITTGSLKKTVYYYYNGDELTGNYKYSITFDKMLRLLDYNISGWDTETYPNFAALQLLWFSHADLQWTVDKSEGTIDVTFTIDTKLTTPTSVTAIVTIYDNGSVYLYQTIPATLTNHDYTGFGYKYYATLTMPSDYYPYSTYSIGISDVELVVDEITYTFTGYSDVDGLELDFLDPTLSLSPDNDVIAVFGSHENLNDKTLRVNGVVDLEPENYKHLKQTYMEGTCTMPRGDQGLGRPGHAMYGLMVPSSDNIFVAQDYGTLIASTMASNLETASANTTASVTFTPIASVKWYMDTYDWHRKFNCGSVAHENASSRGLIRTLGRSIINTDLFPSTAAFSHPEPTRKFGVQPTAPIPWYQYDVIYQDSKLSYLPPALQCGVYTPLQPQITDATYAAWYEIVNAATQGDYIGTYQGFAGFYGDTAPYHGVPGNPCTGAATKKYDSVEFDTTSEDVGDAIDSAIEAASRAGYTSTKFL